MCHVIGSTVLPLVALVGSDLLIAVNDLLSSPLIEEVPELPDP